MIIAATDKIAAVHVDPMIAIADVTPTVKLSVSVTDSAGVPESGVTVYWNSLDYPTSFSGSAITDSTGSASYQVDMTTLPANIYVFPFIAYLDSDPSTSQPGYLRITTPGVKIPEVNDGGDLVIDQYDIQNGVSVTIQSYPNVKPGDLVTFYWDDIHSVGKSISNPQTDLPWIIDVNDSLPPECLVSNQYSLFYQYKDSQGNYGVSSPRMETVTGGKPVPTLPGADFPEADMNSGWINASQALNGTPARLTWPKMAIGDTVSMTWSVYDQNGVEQILDSQLTGTVAQGDIDLNYIQITVPAYDIPPDLQLGSGQAWYTMTPISGGDSQTSAISTVGIDTAP